MKHEPELASQVEKENHVVRRQILNVSWVLTLAIRDKVDWLLHIDSDELINPYSKPDTTDEYLKLSGHQVR